MRRSAILAQRARNNPPAAGAGGGGSSAALPSFVHKSSAPAAPTSAASSNRSSHRATDDDDIDQLYDEMETAAAAGGGAAPAPAAADDDGEVPTSLCLSDAKLKFMQRQRGAAQQKQQSQSQSQPRDSQPAAGAAASAPSRRPHASAGPSSAAAAAATAASSSDAAALPAFTSKKAAPALHRGSGISPIKRPAAANAAPASDEKAERYYNCGYCARSNKKHKNYDDGVLIVCGRRCTLKDMSGKTVSSVLASFSTDRMEEGAFYLIASSEVELGTPIEASEYLSGRIFVGSTSAAPAPSGSAAFAGTKSAVTPFNRIKASNASAKNNDPGGGAAMLQAIMADPTLLLLNQTGITEHGEKALVDQFLCKHLREHQRHGVQFLYNAVMGVSSKGYEGCILADEMGLGKTLQAITLIYTLLNMSPRKLKGGECSKAIVVCPATLLNNWNREFTKWLGSHRCKPVVLTASLNSADQQTLVRDFVMGAGKDYSVLIVSYELFRKHTAALSQLTNLLLICDEGHRLKSTQQNKTIKALSQLKTKKRIMLTGTPVQNDLGEFFAMCDFVNPNIMGSLHTFRQTFETPISRSRDASAEKKVKALGEARAEELAQRTKNFVLRRTSELLLQYLPEKVEQVLFIPLMPLQAELYRALLRSKDVKRLLARGSGGPNDALCPKITAHNSSGCSGGVGLVDLAVGPGRFVARDGHHLLALQCIGQLKKLANHPALVYEECMSQSGADEVKSAASLFPANYVPVANFADTNQSSKLAVLAHLLDAIRREGQKVVVVSNYIQTLDMLEQFLQARGYQWLRLDGHTPAAERPVIVDRFNATYAAEHFVFLLSSKAGGVGLNLIGGNRLILFDPDWNPAIDLQAMSRVWRDGQKSTVYIYRFLSTATIDEKIYQRQLRKNELSWSVMNKGATARGESSLRNFDQSALKDIFSYRDITLCETRDTLAKSSKTDEQQAELAMSIGEFHTDLAKAKDPILQTLPSRLVSTFLNRVSSMEENQRMLKQLAERAKKDVERALDQEEGGKGAKAKAKTGVDEEDFEEEEEEGAAAKENQSGNDGAAVLADMDEDEGECEFGEAPSSASAANAAPTPVASRASAGASASGKPFTSAFTAPPRSHHALHTSALPPPRSRLSQRASKTADAAPASSSSSLNWPTDEELEAEAAMADAMQPDDDAEAEAEFEAPPALPRSSGAGHKRRRIVDEEDEEEEEESRADPPLDPSAKRRAGAADEPHSESISTQPASAHSELLDAAAATVVPPPAPVFFTLDTISSDY